MCKEVDGVHRQRLHLLQNVGIVVEDGDVREDGLLGWTGRLARQQERPLAGQAQGAADFELPRRDLLRDEGNGQWPRQVAVAPPT